METQQDGFPVGMIVMVTPPTADVEFLAEVLSAPSRQMIRTFYGRKEGYTQAIRIMGSEDEEIRNDARMFEVLGIVACSEIGLMRPATEEEIAKLSTLTKSAQNFTVKFSNPKF